MYWVYMDDYIFQMDWFYVQTIIELLIKRHKFQKKQTPIITISIINHSASKLSNNKMNKRMMSELERF